MRLNSRLCDTGARLHEAFDRAKTVHAPDAEDLRRAYWHHRLGCDDPRCKTSDDPLPHKSKAKASRSSRGLRHLVVS